MHMHERKKKYMLLNLILPVEVLLISEVYQDAGSRNKIRAGSVDTTIYEYM